MKICIEKKMQIIALLSHTVDPVYSERVLQHRSLIYSKIKYVYSEYSALVNGSFTINGFNCNYNIMLIELVLDANHKIA